MNHWADSGRKNINLNGHVPCEEIRNVFVEALRKLRDDHFADQRRPPLKEIEEFMDAVKFELFGRAAKNAEDIYARNPKLRADRPAPPAMTQMDSRDDYEEHKKRIMDRVTKGL